ncbi:hypothetical protein FACS1894142_6930 [Spirochaetia bacterium]|nr:hypothetical protein FACS1894142_6930 [Spirochaetia bacterium]
MVVCIPLLVSGCAGTPKRAAVGPDWIYAPSAVYPESQFISAVGYGLDRESAEKNALASLASIFGQSVQGETTAIYRYAQAVADGRIDMGEHSAVESAVTTSVALDTLIGAEIKDRWFDRGDTWYAIAVMDRLTCGQLYAELIESNLGIIRTLTARIEADRYSLEAYTRLILAADIADANGVFLNVLSVLNPASAALRRNEVRSGEEYRVEGREIIANTPVAVHVTDDPTGRIAAAFNAALSTAGFRTGGNGRYTLEVSFSLTEVELPRNSNKFVRYVLEANLRDTRSGQLLLPFAANGREGHTTRPEAENRALRAAENTIRGSFGEALAAYLTQSSPGAR